MWLEDGYLQAEIRKTALHYKDFEHIGWKKIQQVPLQRVIWSKLSTNVRILYFNN